MKLLHFLLAGVIAGALALVAPAPANAATTYVTVGSQTRALDGVNVYRAANFLVEYTPAFGSSTGTNQWGFEAAVVNGKVTAVQNGVGNMAIPSNGFVLSGNGDARSWLQANATVGTSVALSSSPPPTSKWVTINGASIAISGTNQARLANQLILYTPAFGSSTGTNQWGFEAAVVNGVVSSVQDGVGNMAIPSNGYVLSGHGTAAQWLRTRAPVGSTVTLSSTQPPPTVTQNLPDIGIRTLRGFFITYSGSTKLLKFPVVTVNVGNGPLEIHATRSSTTSTDWVAHQIVYNSDGSKTTLPATGAQFYYATDGHNHWHIRDFDLYQLFNSSGTELKEGEKHGFCFFDNTTYRDWVGSPAHPEVPTSAVYTYTNTCGQGDPNATSIVHGLSVGWGDTYPTTLPDQAIDITGIPDGVYWVKVTADWQNFWKETNENDNSASAQIRITGNTVTLLSAPDGF